MVQSIGKNPHQMGGTPITGGVSTGQTKEVKGSGGLQLDEQPAGFQAVSKKKLALVGGASPELETPTTTSSGNDMVETANSIRNVLGSLSSDGSKGYFVLLQILMLLQDAVNEMQQTMQVMRQAETNIAIANIEAEAATMESAAKFGMVLGIISSAVQIAGSAFSMAGGIKAAASSTKTLQTGNQMKTTQQELTALKANPDAKPADIEAKQMQYNGLRAKLDITTNVGQTRAARVQAIGQFIGSFASLAKTFGDGMAGLKQADAKRIEGQVKLMDEQAAKTGELVKGVKDMLSAILNLMNSVAKNESDTNAQVMNRI